MADKKFSFSLSDSFKKLSVKFKSFDLKKFQKSEFKFPNPQELISKLNPKNRRSNLITREINLVPDVKDEMIKALKMRNFILFLCIVVASGSVAVILIFASIAGGQQAIVDGKKTTLTTLSKKVSDYSDLSDFLTIKDQLGNIATITENKKVLSRTFTILSALLPSGADTIKISELSINLAADEPTLSFDAQANAGDPPYIDYNVLDSFKKSMQYMRYDYGSYVDKAGTELPAYCIIESGTDGAHFYDSEKGYYAYWLITGEGCNPSYEPDYDDDGNEIYDEVAATKDYEVEEFEGSKVVKIWRTPQFADWYKETEKEGEPYMSLSGEIANVAHFSSACTTYYGSENENENKNDDPANKISWSSDNSCELVPEGTDGISITDSSNGRGSSGDLVLRFTAVITLDPGVYSFSNKHVLAVAPSGRHNVTDSYVQIQTMFGERAKDCAVGDTACFNNSNLGGN